MKLRQTTQIEGLPRHYTLMCISTRVAVAVTIARTVSALAFEVAAGPATTDKPVSPPSLLLEPSVPDRSGTLGHWYLAVSHPLLTHSQLMGYRCQPVWELEGGWKALSKPGATQIQ